MKVFPLLGILALFLFPCVNVAAAAAEPYRDPARPVDERVRDLLTAARKKYKNTASPDKHDAKSRRKRRSTQENPSAGGRRTRSMTRRCFSIMFRDLLKNVRKLS